MVFLGLTSCFQEIRTFIDYSVQNNSSTPISIIGSDNIHAKNLNQLIIPGQKMTVTTWTRMGRSIEFFEPEIIFSDTLLILNANGDTLKKDFWKKKNWEQDISTTRETATHKYIFEVQDKDF